MQRLSRLHNNLTTRDLQPDAGRQEHASYLKRPEDSSKQ